MYIGYVNFLGEQEIEPNSDPELDGETVIKTLKGISLEEEICSKQMKEENEEGQHNIASESGHQLIVFRIIMPCPEELDEVAS